MSKEFQNSKDFKNESDDFTHLSRIVPSVQSRIQSKVTSKIQAKLLADSDKKKDGSVEQSVSTQLPEGLKSKMENSFGHDFSGVTIHKDSGSAQEIQAKAYTQGNEIHFAPGEFNPSSKEGQQLIGHELAHVVQQGQGKVGATEIHGKGLAINQDEALEKEADEAGFKAAKGEKQGAFHPVERGSVQMKANASGLPESASSYLPDEPTLLLQMQAATLADRMAFVSGYFSEVKINWDQCNTLGIIAKLEDAETKSGLMAKSTVTPLQGVNKNAPQYYHAYLNINKDNTATDEISSDESSTIIAKKLFTGALSIANVSVDGYTATQAIMNLRRMNEILIRMTASYNTSVNTGVPIEEVLTMYRVEGEMGVPNSKASMDNKIPSGRKSALTSLNLGAIDFDISNMTLLFNEAQIGGASDDEIKGYALRVWAIQLAGLDQVGGFNKAGFANWSHTNWVKAGQAMDTIAMAEKRWDNLFDNIMLDTVSSDTGTSTARRVTIHHPIDFVQGILSESVMLHQRYEKDSVDLLAVPGQANKNLAFTPEMAYLRYHAGDANLKMILMSAILAAHKSVDVAYQPLLLKINASSGLKKLLASGSPSNALWPSVALWLKSDPQAFNMLTNFIEHAGMTDWNSWETHRGGLSRYKVLHEYYKTLMN